MYFQFAYSSAPAMVKDIIREGPKYPLIAKDKDGDWLEGSNTYKLHLPAHIPAALFWAVTICNPEDGTMPATAQPFWSRNQYDKVLMNTDGSIEL